MERTVDEIHHFFADHYFHCSADLFSFSFSAETVRRDPLAAKSMEAPDLVFQSMSVFPIECRVFCSAWLGVRTVVFLVTDRSTVVDVRLKVGTLFECPPFFVKVCDDENVFDSMIPLESLPCRVLKVRLLCEPILIRVREISSESFPIQRNECTAGAISDGILADQSPHGDWIHFSWCDKRLNFWDNLAFLNSSRENPIEGVYCIFAWFKVRVPILCLSFPVSATAADAIKSLNSQGFIVQSLLNSSQSRNKLRGSALLRDFQYRVFEVEWKEHLVYMDASGRARAIGKAGVNQTFGQLRNSLHLGSGQFFTDYHLIPDSQRCKGICGRIFFVSPELTRVRIAIPLERFWLKEISPMLTLGDMIEDIVPDFPDLSGQSYAIATDHHALDDQVRLYSLLFVASPPVLSLVPSKLHFPIAFSDRSFDYEFDRRKSISDVCETLADRFTFSCGRNLQFRQTPVFPNLPLESLPGLARYGLTILGSPPFFQWVFVDLANDASRNPIKFDLSMSADAVHRHFTSHDGTYHFYNDRDRRTELFSDPTSSLFDAKVVNHRIYFEFIPSGSSRISMRLANSVIALPSAPIIVPCLAPSLSPISTASISRLPQSPVISLTPISTLATASRPSVLPSASPSPLLSVTLVLPDHSSHFLSLDRSTLISSVLVIASRLMAQEGELDPGHYGLLFDEEPPFLLLTTALGDLGTDSFDLFVSVGEEMIGSTLYLPVEESPLDSDLPVPLPVSPDPMTFAPPSAPPMEMDIGGSIDGLEAADGRCDPPVDPDGLADSKGFSVCRWGIVLDGGITVSSPTLKCEHSVRFVPESMIRGLNIEAFGSEIQLRIACDVTVYCVHDFLSHHFLIAVSMSGLYGNGVLLSDDLIVDRLPSSISFVRMFENSKTKPLNYSLLVGALISATGAPSLICRQSLTLHDYDFEASQTALLSLSSLADDSAESTVIGTDW
jgi:hypothetical protein